MIYYKMCWDVLLRYFVCVSYLWSALNDFNYKIEPCSFTQIDVSQEYLGLKNKDI